MHFLEFQSTQTRPLFPLALCHFFSKTKPEEKCCRMFFGPTFIAALLETPLEFFLLKKQKPVLIGHGWPQNKQLIKLLTQRIGHWHSANHGGSVNIVKRTKHLGNLKVQIVLSSFFSFMAVECCATKQIVTPPPLPTQQIKPPSMQ